MYKANLFLIVVVFCGTIPFSAQQYYQIGAGDCADVYAFQTAGPKPESGPQQLFVGYGRRNVTAYCDMSTNAGGWTVIQRRTSPAVDFYRGWEEYEKGFGNPASDYWLGLTYIHSLTASKRYTLRVELTDWSNNKCYAEYNNFVVDGAGCRYKLSSLGDYCGDCGDTLSPQLGMNFTTNDRDYDMNPTQNCAVIFHGAWWYQDCHWSNLNGYYFVGGNHTSYANGMDWSTWRGQYYSMMRTEMKIRPYGF